MSDTYKLQYPIEVGGEKLDTVTIRRPKRGDYRRIAKVKDQGEAADKLMCDLCELTPDQIAELDMVDYDAIGALIEGFLPEHMRSPDRS